MSTSVSALVVSWHSRSDLGTCLPPAIEQTHQVVLVDNDSRDGTVEWVRERFPTVMVIANHSNVGFAAAVNQAARNANGTLLLLLNPDTRLRAGAVEALVQALDQDRGLAAVGGHLVDEEGRTQEGFTVRRFPSLASLAADLLLLDELWPGNPWTRRYRAVDLDYRRSQDVDQPAAACLLVRRSVFDSLGGFDELFQPAWFEDVDFCKRVTAAGHRIGFVSEALVQHRGGSSLRALPRAEFLEVWYANMRRYVHRHHGPNAERLLRVLIAAGMMLRMTVSTLRRDTHAARMWAQVLRSTIAKAVILA